MALPSSRDILDRLNAIAVRRDRTVNREENSLLSSSPSSYFEEKGSDTTSGRSNSNNYFGNDTSHNFCGSNYVIVQKVRVAPNPNLVVRCYFSKAGKQGRFLLQDRTARIRFKRYVLRYGGWKQWRNIGESFLRTIQNELNDLVRITELEGRLWRDFQFLVDTEGRIYHIDVDRIEQEEFPLKPPKEKARNRCIQNTLAFFEKLIISGTSTTSMAAFIAGGGDNNAPHPSFGLA